jgi:uncharacterized protein (TIGR00251 family)
LQLDNGQILRDDTSYIKNKSFKNILQVSKGIWMTQPKNLVIEVKVLPSAGKHEWILDKNDNLKCYLKNPAERGLANAELLNSLAKILHIARDDVVLLTGATSKKKLIKINTLITREEIIARLGIARQQRII